MPERATVPEVRIDALREDGSEQARGDLLNMLRTSEDPTTRNAAALALSDLGEARLVDAVAHLLRDPRTQGSRGTLLYALGPFDTRGLAKTLMDIATSGAFEASREAFSLLEAMHGPLSNEDHDACEALARARLDATTDPEHRAWLSGVVQLFETPGMR